MSKKTISIPLAFLALYPFFDAFAQKNSFLNDISKLDTSNYSTPQAPQEEKTTPALNTLDKEKKNKKTKKSREYIQAKVTILISKIS